MSANSSTLPVSRLSIADHIIALSKSGNIVEQGTYRELAADPGSYVYGLPVPEGTQRPVKDNLEMMAFSDPRRLRPLSMALLDFEMPAPHDGRRTGDMSIYWYYIKTLGIWRSLIFVVLICGYVVGITFPCESIIHFLCLESHTDV